MNRRARLALGVLLAACAVAAVPAEAQEKKFAVLPFDGSQGFRHLLKLQGLRPLRSVHHLAAVANESVLIVLGEPSEMMRVLTEMGGLQAFRKQGGTILVATDWPDPPRMPKHLGPLGLVVQGSVIVDEEALGEKPGLGYRGKKTCPLVPVPAAARHPVLRGLGRGIATNQPSSLVPMAKPVAINQPSSPVPEGPKSDLVPLLHFPPGCVRFFRRPGVGVGLRSPLHSELTLMYGSAADADGGRVLVIADRSVFMNGMLALPDTDNWAFARKCAEWLAEAGKRKHALLIENGRVLSNFDVPLLQVPLPRLEVVNRVLRGLENENFFNRLMLETVPRSQILHYLFLGASGLLLLYGLFRIARAHHHGDTAVPLLAARVAARPDPELPLVARRTDAALRGRNCYEAARDVARLCLEGADGQAPVAPPVVRAGGRRLRRAVARLWRLAYGDRPTPVSPEEFATLAAAAAQVRAALEDETLRFEEASAADTNPKR